MPSQYEPKKDVVSCEKPRGAANERRTLDIRMGKPVLLEAVHSVQAERQAGELKHLSNPRRRKKNRFP